jgi:hypothetical protein
MLRIILAFFGYAKVPNEAVLLSVHQEELLRILQRVAESDIQDVEFTALGSARMITEAYKRRLNNAKNALDEALVTQQELTKLLRSCRRLS